MSSSADVRELRQIGLDFFQQGRTGEAAQVFSTLITAGVADAEIYKCAAMLLAGAGQPGPAIELIDTAIALAPRDPVSHNVLSYCCIQTGDFSRAETAAKAALALYRNLPEAWNNLAIALNRMGRNEEALAAVNRAVALSPGDADVLLNRANVLRGLDRSEEGLEALDQALVLAPNAPVIWYNRANLLQDVGRHADAIGAFDRAIERAPDYAEAHWNRSLCLLLMGDYVRGFAGYEWRWKNPAARPVVRDFSMPLWLGEADVAGAIVLVHCEQGYGDAIQFIRYAAPLAERGATVIVEALAPVADLFEGVAGVARVIRPGQPAPEAAYHCPLMSLPLALGATAENIPHGAGYLKAPAASVEIWRDRLGEKRRLRIGLVYCGSATHGNDHNRSIALSTLLAGLPDGADYFLLQTEHRDGDALLLAQRPDIHAIGAQFTDFRDTAAVCALMDLIVSVDTSVAHLACALARPTWVLVPYDPDWRWGLNTADCAWYPTARIIRQVKRGDWGDVMQRLQRELSALVGKV